jgi:hypothetical protein
MSTLRMTLIGGPTALIEIDGFRLLTDPTEYRRHPERIHLPSLRGALATKQSIPRHTKAGLLRGACHRARIRATR